VKILPLRPNDHLFFTTEALVREIDGLMYSYPHSGCGTCDDGRELIVTDNYVIPAEKCPYPQGITTETTVRFSSGKIVVTDDLRPIYDGFDAESFASYNTALGTAQVVQTFAAQGCAFGCVLNTCPSLYRVSESKYVIANLHYDEDDVLPEGWQELAGIVTDLWAYSIADYEDWTSKGGDPSELRWGDNVIDFPVGTYRVIYHGGERDFDPHGRGTIIFAEIEKMVEGA
jgi:hypothetical protein